GLHAAKERLKRLLDPAQDILAGGEIREAQAAIGPNHLELVGLIVVVERGVRRAGSIPALLKRSIIQMPRLFELSLQGVNLLACRIEPIAVALPHLRPSLLLDIPLNRGRRDVPSRPDIVASGPKTRQTAAQVRKLLAELMTRGPFDAVHHLSRGKGWRYFD